MRPSPRRTRRSGIPSPGLVLLAAGVLTATSCGGDSAAPACTPRSTTTLAVGTPVRDTAAAAGTRHFSAPLTPGVAYAVALVGISDSATSLSLYHDDCFTTSLADAPSGYSPRELTVTPTASPTWLALTRDAGAAGATHQVILVFAVPSALDPQVETATVAAETPSVGQVATRGTSTYTATGLQPGAAYTVSITALTSAADLHVYTDSTRSWELDCTLNAGLHTTNAPQECTTTAAGTSVYFRVASGAVNLAGARYVILVSRF
jgi:hypothetical protein